ncbi:MAG TPA: Gfo/Idh/MocA family oxidoreductase [Chloroflexota bacterium]
MDGSGRVRWGILGDAEINASLIPGAHAAPSAEVVGIASRRPGVAAQTAQRWNIPRSHDSYDALLEDEEIDAVYIPLANHEHAEWTIRSANAGKHVLCEKPLALTLEEVRGIQEAAERNGVQVAEAFMYRFTPRWHRAEEMVWDGSVGDPRIIRIGFAFYHDVSGYNIRFDPQAGGGIIWDMGCYAVNMARMLLRAEPMSAFCAAHTYRGTAVETSIELILRFADDRAAVGHCSFDYTNPHSEVEVVGTEGWISLPGTGFRREPETYILSHHYKDKDDEIYLRKAEPERQVFPWVDPYMLEVESLNESILHGRPLPYTLDDAYRNTQVLLALYRSAHDGCEVPIE